MIHKKNLPHNAKELIKKSASSQVLVYEIFLGLLLSLGSIWLFAEIADEVLEQETHGIDVFLSALVYSLRQPWLTEIMQWITRFGAEFTVIISAFVFVFLLLRKYYNEAILFSMTMGIGLVLNIILKFSYQRPRPDIDPLLNLTSYSFPSGHSMNAVILYTLLAYLIYHFTKKKQYGMVASTLAGCIIILVGFSRIYLGVHYPSDVLAGYIAGFFVFITMLVLHQTLRYMESKKEKK